jgi:hypothetical protein
MNKRKKIRISIAIGLLLIIGIVGGNLYMTKQTHNQRVAEMANNLRYEGFETEIVKKLKEKYPDIKAIRFEGTSKNDKTGSYWSTFYIIADWTTGQPESEYYSDFTGYGSIQDIQNSGYSMGITKLMDKYRGTGKTIDSVLVTYSTGKKKEV